MKPRGAYQTEATLEKRLRRAWNFGFGRGYHDKHYESQSFGTGAEYLAWLQGHRAGCAERLREAVVERKGVERENAVMLAMLERAA